MFTRAYLRASTTEQDANRARQQLSTFAQEHGATIASWYVENESGAQLQRPELHRLIADAHPGDVLLVEAIDRLSRLSQSDWHTLRQMLDAKQLRVVAVDLPLSWPALAPASDHEDFTARMLDALNRMMLDMLAAIARKDYEQRRQRQAQGIEKAKANGKYLGRVTDTAKHAQIRALLAEGQSIRTVAKAAKCSPTTVQTVKNAQAAQRAADGQLDWLEGCLKVGYEQADTPI